MRLIDADELLEHAYRDKLDSRELIADMITKAPTIKEVTIEIEMENTVLLNQTLVALARSGHQTTVETKPDPKDFWWKEKDYLVFRTKPGEIKEENNA